jgi:hypothetical protein
MLLVVAFVPTSAGNAQKGAQPGSKIRVTGCLQRSGEADVFRLKGDKGQSYDLVSTSVQLSEYVARKVIVAGVFIGKEDEEDETRQDDEGWSGKIQVTSLNKVADRCN